MLQPCHHPAPSSSSPSSCWSPSRSDSFLPLPSLNCSPSSHPPISLYSPPYPRLYPPLQASDADFTDWVSGLASQAGAAASSWGSEAKTWASELGSDGKDWLKEKMEKYTGGMIENVKDAAACATAGGKWEEMQDDVSGGAKEVAACFSSDSAAATALPILVAASIFMLLARIA